MKLITGLYKIGITQQLILVLLIFHCVAHTFLNLFFYFKFFTWHIHAIGSISLFEKTNDEITGAMQLLATFTTVAELI